MSTPDKHIILRSKDSAFRCEDAAKVMLSIQESYRDNLWQIVIGTHCLDLFFRDEVSLKNFREDCKLSRFKITQHLQSTSVVSFGSHNSDWYSVYAKFPGGDDLFVRLHTNEESSEASK